MSDPEGLATPLGAGREFDRIRHIARRLGPMARDLGDDCAPIPPGEGTLLVSTDAAVEGTHFLRGWLSPPEIGWRASAAALSDLAAMGARPAGQLVALTVPAGGEVPEVTEVMAGVADLAARTGCPILGGDLTRGERWNLAVTVVGYAARPVWRRGARPGEALWVTGALGGSRAALESWNTNRPVRRNLQERFARPEPRLAVGQWLGGHGATAMIDVSDGLAGDVGHLAAASGVTLEVDLALVPIDAGVAEMAAALGQSARIFAARGGEDYELAVTLPASFTAADSERCLRDTAVPLTRIGTVLAADTPSVRLMDGGREVRLAGWDHFA